MAIRLGLFTGTEEEFLASLKGEQGVGVKTLKYAEDATGAYILITYTNDTTQKMYINRVVASQEDFLAALVDESITAITIAGDVSVTQDVNLSGKEISVGGSLTFDGGTSATPTDINLGSASITFDGGELVVSNANLVVQSGQNLEIIGYNGAEISIDDNCSFVVSDGAAMTIENAIINSDIAVQADATANVELNNCVINGDFSIETTTTPVSNQSNGSSQINGRMMLTPDDTNTQSVGLLPEILLKNIQFNGDVTVNVGFDVKLSNCQIENTKNVVLKKGNLIIQDVNNVAFLKSLQYDANVDADAMINISVADEQDLQMIASAANYEDLTFEGFTVLLTQNITLQNSWTPIAQGGYRVVGETSVFKGIFDGQGYTINGLTDSNYNPGFTYKSDHDGEYAFGLFGVVDGAVIKNVKLTNVAIVGNGDSVGALVGYCKGSLTVEDCDVLSGSICGADAIAGLVGRAYNYTAVDGAVVSVKNCSNGAGITASVKAAGIIGYAVVGLTAEGSLIVDGCSNSGMIYGTAESAANDNKGSFVSGIVNFGWDGDNGYAESITITNNSNSGLIKQAYAHDITFVATSCSMNYTIDEGDSYNFTGNTNTGSYEIENLADENIDWYVNQTYKPVLVTLNQNPIVYIYYTDVVTYNVTYSDVNNQSSESND